jgi:ATP-binding cassette subfamily A (ABC1) protein 3
MSINIYKEIGADDKAIIEFFENNIEGVTHEKLSEEILFKIPKDANNFNIKCFFELLDSKVKELKIKNYSAAMPTLEDVFLNVAVMKKENEDKEDVKFNQNEEKNDQIMFFQKYEADYTPSEKFRSDMGILFYKRFKLVYRDMKTFFLEIVCPIILVVIGCVVVQVDIFKETTPFGQDVDFFGKQVIYYSKVGGQNISDSLWNELKNISEFVNVTVENLDYNREYTGVSSDKIEIKHYLEELYDTQKSGKESFASYLFTKEDTDNAQYEIFEFINARGRHGPGVYTPYILKKILKSQNITFEYTHYPLPMTEDIKGYGKSLNNFCLVFFVTIAFGLIPANFVATIVGERVNNSKHLMRIAGVSLFAYWLVNFIFEIIKYYVTAGICLLILWAFDFIPDYFYIDYLLYGPAMVSSTYLFSFFFDSEAIAQNALILFNLILGCLASTVVIMLRSLEDTTNGAKPAAWILRFIPTFAFGYAYDQLLNGKLILFIDYGIEYSKKKSSEYLKLKYAGGDFLFMGIFTVIYLLIIVIIENESYSFKPCPDSQIDSNIQDPLVNEEIKRANSNEYVRKIKNENDYKKLRESDTSNNYKETEKEGLNVKRNDCYSVKLKNVKKLFNKNGCCSGEKIEAIKNLSFCVEYGECFGLLGLNGAGKTTTFKCITQEHSPSHGSIEIDGKDISTHFSEVRSMFGYCPQFDAIFEFMTVYENLKFYSYIKGVDPAKTDELIEAMLESMMLSNYKDKVSRRLSGGNKRKLSVAISMICNPPIILLDEPSTGLDPEARRFMWLVIHKIATKRAKSSVIMTTHAMDEAETLCRRMGIMVNGEFVCLGSSNEIKERYGYGYEIDVRIKPLAQEQLDIVYSALGVDKHHKVTIAQVSEILRKLNRLNYKQHLANDKIGRKIFNEMELTGSTSIHTFVSWIYYVNNAINLINSTIINSFPEIVLTEFIENNFLFKVRKEQGENAKSIGFLFSALEKSKDSCNITEYSIQQTSLEQIFNDFAQNQGKTEEELKKAEKKVEIPINEELVRSLLD